MIKVNAGTKGNLIESKVINMLIYRSDIIEVKKLTKCIIKTTSNLQN